MSVRQLPNGKWVADVTVGWRWDGKRDRRVVQYDTKKAAMRGEAQLLLERMMQWMEEDASIDRAGKPLPIVRARSGAA